MVTSKQYIESNKRWFLKNILDNAVFNNKNLSKCAKEKINNPNHYNLVDRKEYLNIVMEELKEMKHDNKKIDALIKYYKTNSIKPSFKELIKEEYNLSLEEYKNLWIQYLNNDFNI